MAENVGSLFVTVGADIRSVSNGLNSVKQQMNSAAQTGRQMGDSMGATFMRVGTQVLALAGIGGFAALSAKVTSFAKDAMFVAARVEEMRGVLSLLGERAGYTAAQLDQMTLAVKAQGIETGVAQELLAQMARYEMDLGKATELARVAQDAAVISMQNSSEALAGLTHGIMTFNPRVLRTYGIITDMAGAFEKHAASLGKAADELTTSEKVNAALNAVLEQGVAIQGAYETAMESASKQWRSMPRYINELKEAVGGPLLGAFDAAIFAIADFTKGLRDSFQEGGQFHDSMVRIGDALQELVARGLPVLFEGLTKAVSALLQAAEAGLGAAKAFMDLPAPVKAAVAALVLVPPAITAITAAGAALGALAASFNPIVLAVAALAGGLVYLRQKADEMGGYFAAQQANYETLKVSLLDAADGAEDYANRVMEATGRTEEAARSAATWGQSLGAMKAEMGELSALYLVHNGNLNIAEAGIKKLGATMEKFGGDVQAAADKVKGPLNNVSLAYVNMAKEVEQTSQELVTEISQTWDQGFSQIQDAFTQHYQAIAQLTQQSALENIRSTAEYNAKRAQLVAEGRDDEVAELDAGYKEAKILRELDQKLALMQLQAKHRAEMAERMRAFGEKMAWWLFEHREELNLTTGGLSAVLAGLSTGLGQQVSLYSETGTKILDIIKSYNEGAIGSTEEMVAALGGLMKELVSDADEAAKDAAKNFGINLQDAQDAINEAYDKIAGLSTAGVSRVGEATEKAAEDVVADFASTVDRLFKATASIMETVSAKLPSLPTGAIGKWLGGLLDISEQIGDWMVSGRGAGLKALVDWWHEVLHPQLERWAEVMGPVVDLFGAAADLTAQLGEEVTEAKSTVTDVFDAVLSIAEDFITYANASASRWMAAEKQLYNWREELTEWATALEATSGVFQAASDIVGAFGDIADDFRPDVAKLLDTTLRIAQEFIVYCNRNAQAWAQPYQTLLDWQEAMASWATALSGLADLLSVASDVVDAASGEVADYSDSLGTLFVNLSSVMARMDYISGTAIAMLIDDLVEQWLAKGGLVEKLTRWATALAPLADALGAASDVVDRASQAVGEYEESLGPLFVSLSSLMARMEYIAGTAVAMLIDQMAQDWLAKGGLAEKLAEWTRALEPLHSFLSMGQNILAVTSQELQKLDLNLEMFFSNLLIVANRSKTWFERNSRAVQNLIDAFAPDKKTGLVAQLNKLKESLSPLQNVLSSGASILGVTAEFVKPFRLDLGRFFGNLQRAMDETQSWLDFHGDDFISFTQVFAERIGPQLDLWAEGLQPIDDVLSLGHSIMGSLSTKVKQLQIPVIGFLNKLLEITWQVGEWVFAQGPEFPLVMQILRDLIVAALTPMREALGPVEELFSILQQFATAEGEAPPDFGKTFSGVILPMMNAIIAGLQALQAQLAGETWESLMESLDAVQAAMTRMVDIVNFATGEGEGAEGQVSALFTAANSAGLAVGNGLASGLMLSYETVYWAAAGALAEIMRAFVDVANHVIGAAGSLGSALASTFASNVAAGAGGAYSAGKAVGNAALQGLKDALGVHSPSREMIKVAQNVLAGWNIGLQDNMGAAQLVGGGQVVVPVPRGGGGGGSQIVNVHVHGNVYGIDDLFERVDREMSRRLRRQGVRA